METESVTRDIHPELLESSEEPEDEVCTMHETVYSIAARQKLQVMALSSKTDLVRSAGRSGFFESIFYSYYNHLPLNLTPDQVWIAILQAVSLHITNKSEELRDKFVNFPDKKQLTVVVNPWTNSSQDWENGFKGFSALIEENLIPEARGLVKPKFSTTTPLTSAVCDVTIMDCFKNYFKYSLRGGCGIPRVTLAGTVADWELLRDQASKLIAYADLAWWLPYIQPILEEFVSFYKVGANTKFWDCIIKPCPAAGSGNYFWKEGYHERLSGWIINFFPHTVTPIIGMGAQVENQKLIEAKNRAMLLLPELYAIHDEFDPLIKKAESKGVGAAFDLYLEYMKHLKHGFELKYLPSNISTVGVDFENFVTGEKYRAIVQAGFFGYQYDEEKNQISPALGWFVGKAN